MEYFVFSNRITPISIDFDLQLVPGYTYLTRLPRSQHHFAWALRAAAHRRFVAAIIARLPAALSFRFFRAGVGPTFAAPPDCFRASAHRLR